MNNRQSFRMYQRKVRALAEADEFRQDPDVYWCQARREAEADVNVAESESAQEET
ncbi:MAG: hypothetical protein GDA39_01275 [Hyphomonadaceae bacterium]|nr:hypothetical protein [Hyphomonadaceae bacterium]